MSNELLFSVALLFRHAPLFSHTPLGNQPESLLLRSVPSERQIKVMLFCSALVGDRG